MQKVAKILFVLGGIVPLLGLLSPKPFTTLLIYSLFVLIYLFRHQLRPFIRNLPFKASIKLVLLILLSSWLMEALAWLTNFLAKESNPALFHPQLIPNLLLATGAYIGWAIVLGFLLKKYAFSLKEVFILFGLYGVIFEQNGAILLQGLLAFPLGILFWLLIFIIYGSTAGSAYTLVEDEFINQNQKGGWLKYILALILVFVVSKIIFTAFWLVLKILNLLPASKPIWQFPFW